jgi:hypothetical protein
MLYNPNWRDPNPLTLEKLAAWLEMQDPNQTYDYNCGGRCLLALYVRAKGYPQAMMGGYEWWPENSMVQLELPKAMNDVAVGSHIFSCSLEYSFGAALARCREAMAARTKELAA